MQNHFKSLAVSVVCLFPLFATVGCATSDVIEHAGRSHEEREELIRPGDLGGAADNRRWLFDFWNKQVVREDVLVGTVFMGDSITEFWNLPVYFTATNGIMQNRGIGGDNPVGLHTRLEQDVFQYSPRRVFMLVGINGIQAPQDWRFSLAISQTF